MLLNNWPTMLLACKKSLLQQFQLFTFVDASLNWCIEKKSVEKLK